MKLTRLVGESSGRTLSTAVRAPFAGLPLHHSHGRDARWTRGKMPTWKTTIVPVRSIGGNKNAFFESWCAEQGIEPPLAPTLADGDDAKQNEIHEKIKQLIAVQNRPAPISLIEQLPHVVEEQHPGKSFDLVRGAMLPSESKHGPEALGYPDADGDPSQVEGPCTSGAPR